MNEPSRENRLLGGLLGPAGPELTCERCFEELDRYVELELAGGGRGRRNPGHARTPPGMLRLRRGPREPPGAAHGILISQPLLERDDLLDARSAGSCTAIVSSGSGLKLICSAVALARQAAGSGVPCWVVSCWPAAWIAFQTSERQTFEVALAAVGQVELVREPLLALPLALAVSRPRMSRSKYWYQPDVLAARGRVPSGGRACSAAAVRVWPRRAAISLLTISSGRRRP